MKKNYWNMVLRTVRGSFSRFLAIFAITALGVGFLVGLLCTAPDMMDSVDQYYDDSQLFDLDIKSTKGLTQEDVSAVGSVDGVTGVMPSYQKDILVMTSDGENTTARLHVLDFSLDSSDMLDMPTLLEGRFPEKPGECVAITSSAFAAGIQVGESITLEPEEDDEELFTETTLTVVGLASSPLYMAAEKETSSVGSGSVTYFFYADRSLLDTDIYTDIHVTFADMQAKNTFTDAYQDGIDSYADTVEALADVRIPIRDQEIREEALAEIDDAEEEYLEERADAEEELADAKAELDDARTEIEDGMEALADAEEELADAWEELVSAQKELADAKAELDRNEPDIEKLKKTIADNKDVIAQARSAILLYDEQKAAWASGTKQLAAAKATLEEGRQAYEAGAEQLEQQRSEAEARFDAAGAELEAAKQQLDEQKAYLDALTAALEQYGQQGALPEEADAAEENTQEQEDTSPEEDSAETPEDPETDPSPGMPELPSREELEGYWQAYYAAQQEYEEGCEALRLQREAAEEQLAAAEGELDAAGQQLAAGEAEYEKNRQTLADAEKQLKAAEGQIESARTQVSEWDKNYPVMTEAISAFEEGKSQYASGLASYEDGLRAYEDGAAEVAENKQKLADAQSEYEDGLAEYEDACEEAREKFADAEKELADARDEVDALEAGEWYILDRNTNVSYVSFTNNADKVTAIARVFPIFFFLVAALVALTTMTRMVEEERTEIGTLKALGYSKGAIVAKYLMYAETAGILGSVTGVLIGQWIFPTVIWNAYTIMYYYPSFSTAFLPQYAIPSALASILSVMAATLWACEEILRECPAKLMLPKAPKAGKRILLERIPFIWNPMRFTWKVTARNMFRYKKRLFMTLIGIAGCTALLLTGFGIRDAIGDIVAVQYEQLQHYELTVTLEEDAKEEEIADVESWLEENTEGFMRLYSAQMDIVNGRSTEEVSLIIPSEPDRYSSFMTLRERKSHDTVALDSQAVVLTEKMANTLGIKAGDVITVRDEDDRNRQLTVTGICENYLRAYLYVGEDAWTEAGGGPIDYLTYGVQAPVDEAEEETVTTALLEFSAVSAAQYNSSVIRTFENMISKINYIVVVLIICAGLLAFVVLYNLTNINISERQKEIATIKVLGFYPGEVNAYIYRETVMLSVLGAALGLLLGIALTRFVVVTVEVSSVMFGRQIYPLSFVLAFFITLIFTGIVCLVMARRLRSISMVESMKSVD